MEKKPRRPRGSGRIFQWKGKGPLWIQYYRNGVQIREPADTDKESVAQRLLNSKLGKVADGTAPPPRLDKIVIDELIGDVFVDYEANRQKSLSDTKARWELHLKPFFGGMKAAAIGTDLINQYRAKRRKENAQVSTVNRELALLRRAFNLAYESDPPKVARVPKISLPEEHNIRKGFLKPSEYDRLAQECGRVGLWLRCAFEVAHTYGWRISEVSGLRVSNVDLLSRIIRLEPGTTKSGEGREVVMTQRVFDLLSMCVANKGPDDWLLTRDDGKPVGDFRNSWQNACYRAGQATFACPECGATIEAPWKCSQCGKHTERDRVTYRGLYFHDLRRTAARNLRSEGVAESTIMDMAGWSTRSMFKRYAITDTSDKTQAARALDARQDRQNPPGLEFGVKTGRIDEKRTAYGATAVPTLKTAM